MCMECGRHNTETVWYLDREKHRIKSMGLVKDIIASKLDPLIATGLKMVRMKQPDYVNTKMNIVSRRLLNWFAKTLHGMQFLPNIESAYSIINMANELALMPCLCRKVMDPEKPTLYRCIAMNIAVKIYEKDFKKEDVHPISKENAKELVSQWRKKGSWQSVGWLWNANVIWLCNCDENCVAYRAPEADWGGIPSFMVVKVGQLSNCNGCQECLRWCKHRAISYGEKGTVKVDQNRCKGCGLCIDNCHKKVLVFEPRQIIYDVRTKTIRNLGNEMTQLV